MRDRTFLHLVTTAAFVVLAVTISAQEVTRDSAATVRDRKGTVDFHMEGQPWRKLKKRSELHPGVVIRTGPNSHADINVNGFASVIRLMPETTLQLQKMTLTGSQMEGDRQTALDLKSGAIFGSVKKISRDSSYEIHTPHGMASIRGTDFEIEAKTNREGVAIVTFTAITGLVACAADVEGKTVTKTLNTGETWTPGDGEVRRLSREEIFSKPFSDFLGTIACPVCPDHFEPPTVSDVWHVPCAPAH
jgi:hypothetical protein